MCGAVTVCICACSLHVVDKACLCKRKEDSKSFVLISNLKEAWFPVSRGQCRTEEDVSNSLC